jgi:hypothetical protein
MKGTPSISKIQSTPSKFQSQHIILSPENREIAEKKFLQWEGVQTRKKFTIKEEEVSEWIQQITNQRINANSPLEFYEILAEGTILCTLINNLIPGSIRNIPTGDSESRRIARVRQFLYQCQKVGVEQLFWPEDLVKKKNMVQVVYCLHSLAENCHNQRLAPFFTGEKTDRKKQREEWKKKARESLRHGFEGWKHSNLLAKIKEEYESEEENQNIIF